MGMNRWFWFLMFVLCKIDVYLNRRAAVEHRFYFFYSMQACSTKDRPIWFSSLSQMHEESLSFVVTHESTQYVASVSPCIRGWSLLFVCVHWEYMLCQRLTKYSLTWRQKDNAEWESVSIQGGFSQRKPDRWISKNTKDKTGVLVLRWWYFSRTYDVGELSSHNISSDIFYLSYEYVYRPKIDQPSQHKEKNSYAQERKTHLHISSLF